MMLMMIMIMIKMMIAGYLVGKTQGRESYMFKISGHIVILHK